MLFSFYMAIKMFKYFFFQTKQEEILTIVRYRCQNRIGKSFFQSLRRKVETDIITTVITFIEIR